MGVYSLQMVEEKKRRGLFFHFKKFVGFFVRKQYLSGLMPKEIESANIKSSGCFSGFYLF